MPVSTRLNALPRALLVYVKANSNTVVERQELTRPAVIAAEASDEAEEEFPF